jgi:hypothetical protein
MARITLTLDEETVARIHEASQCLSKSKSQVVQEAILSYRPLPPRLTEQERLRLLLVLDEHLARRPERSQADVDRELREIRLSRRSGGRRTPAE